VSDGAKSRIERLIALTDRLTGMLSADVSVLESGNAKSLNSGDIAFQQLMNSYVREAASVNGALAKSVPLELRQALMQSTKRMNDVLANHQRLVTRVRNASEGVIQAVAKEVERRRVSQRSYGRVPAARPQSTGALVYNSVI
jgi:hypothetical protein